MALAVPLRSLWTFEERTTIFKLIFAVVLHPNLFFMALIAVLLIPITDVLTQTLAARSFEFSMVKNELNLEEPLCFNELMEEDSSYGTKSITLRLTRKDYSLTYFALTGQEMLKRLFDAFEYQDHQAILDHKLRTVNVYDFIIEVLTPLMDFTDTTSTLIRFLPGLGKLSKLQAALEGYSNYYTLSQAQEIRHTAIKGISIIVCYNHIILAYLYRNKLVLHNITNSQLQ